MKKAIILSFFFIAGIGVSVSLRLTHHYHGEHGEQNHSHHGDSALEVDVKFIEQPLETADGGVTSPVELAANAPLLINFWATWCAPCVHEMPLLDEASTLHGIKTIGISYEDFDVVNRFSSQHPVDYRLYKSSFDIFYFLQKLGNRTAVMPYTVLLDASGEVVATKTGDFKDVDEVVAFATQEL